MRIGERIGNYVLESVLGSGGQAEVYLARDVSLHRLAAVKICTHAATLIPVQEARLLARLDHPGIVTVYHLERAGNNWYIALQYLDGGSVADMLKRTGPASLPAALAIGRDTAAALAHAHSRDIVHGDLKPQNMLLSRSGRVSLIDFGLGVGGRAVIGKTPVGTPYFMANELWEGSPPSKPADVYALAVVMCQLISGKLPFPANDVEELRRLQKTQPPRFPESMPKQIRDLLAGCLSLAPSSRPSSEELASALDRLQIWARREKRKRSQAKAAGATTIAPMVGQNSNQLAGALDALLAEYASGSVLAACLSSRVGQAKLLEDEPALSLLEGDGGRMQHIAVELACGRLEWRSLETMMRTDSTLATDDVMMPRGLVVGMDVPAAADARSLRDVAACVARLTKRGAHVVARGPGMELRLLGNAAAVEGIRVVHRTWPPLAASDIAAFVREWTTNVTKRRVRWSWSALSLLTTSFEQGDAPIDRTMHNALMLCLLGGDRVLTTWHVSGGLAHSQYLLVASGVQPEWARKPTPWPPIDESPSSDKQRESKNLNVTANEVES